VRIPVDGNARLVGDGCPNVLRLSFAVEHVHRGRRAAIARRMFGWADRRWLLPDRVGRRRFATECPARSQPGYDRAGKHAQVDADDVCRSLARRQDLHLRVRRAGEDVLRDQRARLRLAM